MFVSVDEWMEAQWSDERIFQWCGAMQAGVRRPRGVSSYDIRYSREAVKNPQSYGVGMLQQCRRVG